MKLSTRQDIEAPIGEVFAALSDFEAWERAALRRGAEVSRADKLGRAGLGASWLTQFSFRGKPRKLAIRLTVLDPPAHLGFTGSSANMDGSLSFDLVELSARRTRVVVATEVKPRTLAARLVLQSARLAKGRLQRRYETRIAQLCRDIEDRHRYRAAR